MTKILQIDREAADEIIEVRFDGSHSIYASDIAAILASHREQATRELMDLLEEAVLQIEYLNERWPTGSSETAITRLRLALTKANPDA